ncbi:response regulator [Microcoleus sp. FACHB-68]|uniref:response regulator n=1 Tax=Microcoleus sp. FACHB-68 TaxID=2692826 RepID=UPI0016832DC1|nr:response regulator [Microcoleus sp. FACHB-68]MBD1940280.1 response regulator [Microcoleus sp. FACHB-68]
MLTRSLNRLIAQFPLQASLQTVLIVPFLLQITAAVGLVGYLSFRNGQKAVNELVLRLQNEASSRVEQHLSSYLNAAKQLAKVNTDALELGLVDPKDLKRQGQFYWKQMQEFNVGYINFGSTTGDYIGAGYEKEKSVIISEVSLRQYGNSDSITYATDNQGNRIKAIENTGRYEYQKEPWYSNTIKAGKPIWSQIYEWEQLDILSISFNRPVRDRNNKIIGVIGIDQRLSQISNFLGKLKVSPSGKIFIIERNGLIVASSSSEQPFTIVDGKPKRLQVLDSTDPLILATGRYLQKTFRDFKEINNSQQLELKLNNGNFPWSSQRQFIKITPWQDKFGLDWLIVTVIPESDFMEQIDHNTRTTIVLCFVALVFATGMAVFTARLIARPIVRLNRASQAIAGGQLNQTINVKGIDELEKLANSFNSMAGQLQQSFETLEKQNEELKHFDQLKDEFLANTSHELRTPLNGIIGLAESLMDGATGELPITTKINLKLIVSSGRRLASLVNDILDFSKLRHKNVELQLKPIDLRSVVNVVLTLSQPLANQKNLQLINSISEDFPSAEADENRLQQILHNLVGNAIKFTSVGSVEVLAQVIIDNTELSTNNQHIAITVSDTGIGIPEDKFDRIFESFEQGEGTAAREYGGTGLGLAVTKKLVELHGGKISLTSKLEKGSQFTFTLPRSQDQVESAQSSLIPDILTSELATLIQSPQLALNATNTKQFKVLIVDDEPVNRQVLLNNLSLYNYEITEATNGQEALDSLEQEPLPDLILLDVMMPRMTGYEVCQKIRDRFPAHELPIVMLTAKNQVQDIIEGFESGANDYLSKPIQKGEMLARIKTHLNLAKLTLAYGRFVPHNFLNFLSRESIIEVQLGDQVLKEMTVMFSDIRDFTTLSEAMTPKENFNFINSYLSQVGPVIRQHRGFIDKYIGDAIMALFPESAKDALQAALAMQKEVALYNQHRQQRGEVPISIGIGLHTGNLMLGTIGESQRMETTAIADAVNLASRLEGLTKLYGAGILISLHTLILVEDIENYSFRFLDRVRVKGKSKPVAVYEVYEENLGLTNQLKNQTKTQFEPAVMAYNRQNFSDAQSMFEEILVINPEDKAAMLYVKRCQHYQQYGVPAGWNGVTDLDFKG